MTILIIIGVLIVAALAFARQPVTDEVWYDPDEVLPATPQPWGIDDYQPWPARVDDLVKEIEVVTAMWNAAMDAGDTALADVLLEEYAHLQLMVQ